jgi:hypothetical protein
MMVLGGVAMTGLALAQTAATAQKKAAPAAPKQAATSTPEQTASAAQKLFIDVSPALVKKISADSVMMPILAPRQDIKRTRMVKINFEALKNPQIILNLFPDAEFIATITSISKGNLETQEAKEYLTGTIEGAKFCRIGMFVYDDYVEATVDMEKLIFRTHFLRDSVILIQEMDFEVMRQKITNKKLDEPR